jgi:hypothetical protein
VNVKDWAKWKDDLKDAWDDFVGYLIKGLKPNPQPAFQRSHSNLRARLPARKGLRNYLAMVPDSESFSLLTKAMVSGDKAIKELFFKIARKEYEKYLSPQKGLSKDQRAKDFADAHSMVIGCEKDRITIDDIDHEQYMALFVLALEWIEIEESCGSAKAIQAHFNYNWEVFKNGGLLAMADNKNEDEGLSTEQVESIRTFLEASPKGTYTFSKLYAQFPNLDPSAIRQADQG